MNWQWEIEEQKYSDQKKDLHLFYNLAAMLTVKKIKLAWLEYWYTLNVHGVFPSQIKPDLSCHHEFDRTNYIPLPPWIDITELCFVFFDEMLPWQELKIAKSKLQPHDSQLMSLGWG